MAAAPKRRSTDNGPAHATIREVYELILDSNVMHSQKLDELEASFGRQMNQMRDRHHGALNDITASVTTVGGEIMRLGIRLEEHERRSDVHGISEAIKSAESAMSSLARSVRRAVSSGNIVVFTAVIADIVLRLIHGVR